MAGMTTHERKESRRDRSIKIATWNLQGHLSQPMEMAQLSRDMRDRNIKICFKNVFPNRNQKMMELLNNIL